MVENKKEKYTYEEVKKAYDIVFDDAKQKDEKDKKLVKKVIDDLRGNDITEKRAIRILKNAISIIEDLSEQHVLH
ncbi:hypothetical protein FEZ39_12435 [Lentilactobacillus parabuchneri]|uniref:Uncharacterized protein n=1 Tax=Lentilactobacillus parabuchneri TaxID=152331 RepID=A0A1X1FDA6_9LACO|nr:hypothetical protein [Lentilactobacillus parabuchneri]ORN27280.1 hypothetical protein FAM23169_01822 [Lentilactobacillus parabuchneri]TLQ28270.1 hypothetical protein FEZ39_12435 [Lentilactobacillus parabuchneri]